MCVHNRINKVGRALLMVTAGVIAAALLAASLEAQSFSVSQNGKSVGSASMALRQTGAGLMLDSRVKIDMPGLKYDFKEKAQLNGGYQLLGVQLDGSVNGTAAKVDVRPEGQQFQVHLDANGQQINTPLAYQQSAIFLPDFDPGGLQVLVSMGAARNNRDLWALVPKQTGSITPLQLLTEQDMQGTLDGRQVLVHHLTASYDTNKIEVFTSPQNELLQAEWSDEGFALVRQGFKLTPPARPGVAPPAAPPQTTQPQGDGQQAQPQQ